MPLPVVVHVHPELCVAEVFLGTPPSRIPQVGGKQVLAGREKLGGWFWGWLARWCWVRGRMQLAGSRTRWGPTDRKNDSRAGIFQPKLEVKTKRHPKVPFFRPFFLTPFFQEFKMNFWSSSNFISADPQVRCPAGSSWLDKKHGSAGWTSLGVVPHLAENPSSVMARTTVLTVGLCNG